MCWKKNMETAFSGWGQPPDSRVNVELLHKNQCLSRRSWFFSKVHVVKRLMFEPQFWGVDFFVWGACTVGKILKKDQKSVQCMLLQPFQISALLLHILRTYYSNLLCPYILPPRNLKVIFRCNILISIQCQDILEWGDSIPRCHGGAPHGRSGQG
jgi:hypothetical protein